MAPSSKNDCGGGRSTYPKFRQNVFKGYKKEVKNFGKSRLKGFRVLADKAGSPVENRVKAAARAEILPRDSLEVHVPNFGGAGSEDFACATLPTNPLIFKAKFKIFVALPSQKSDLRQLSPPSKSILRCFNKLWWSVDLVSGLLTLSGPGGAQRPGWPNSQMTIRNLLLYDAETRWILVFILKAHSDQILAKLINQGVAAALSSSRRPKNFENEKIFLCLKIVEIDMRGSILGREERFWT